MKKIIFSVFLIVLSIFLSPVSVFTNAEEEIQINTLYPENILDYTDLTNISNIAINDNFIAYSLNKTDLILFNKSNREYTTISNFNNINKLKYINDTLLVADNDNIKIINNIETLDANDLETINEISCKNINAIDIYTVNNEVYIGLVKSSTFELYKYNERLVNTQTNPIKTSTSDYFSNCYMLAINNNNAYIVSNVDNPKLYTLNYLNTSPTVKDFKINAQVIDTFYDNNNEYILTFTKEILYLLKSDCTEIDTVKIETAGDSDEDQFPIQEISDFDYFNDTIYICDKKYKTIQTFVIDDASGSYQLLSDKILLSSNSLDLGRFDSVNDFTIQGDKILTADTNNNRIQILDNLKPYVINDLEADSYPNSLIVDNYQNLYLIKNNLSNSILTKYSYTSSVYEKSKEYSQINNVNIGFISDITTTNNNVLYLLDYTNNELLYLTENSLEIKKELPLTLDKSSKIDYLKKSNLLVLLNSNNLYLLNLNGDILSQINIPNATNITTDFNSIYVLANDTINLISIEDNILSLSENKIQDSRIANISVISFDIINRQMIGFDSTRHCLVSFECNLESSPFNFSEFNDSTPLTKSDTLLALTLKSTARIYDYPYYLGNAYNLNNEITNCLAIAEEYDYYRILFNNNNVLKEGFVLKSDIQINTITRKSTNVITTNQLVPVYKYPTILKYNDQTITTISIPINTAITLSATYPISIDGKTFYLYEYDNNIGFIFNADVVLNESKTISYLKTENAEVKSFDEEKIIIYAEDKTTILKKIDNNSRIYVEDFDKNEEYTKVIYKDSSLNTIEGYVLTKYIEMDKLDNSRIIIILIIIISIVLLVIILTSYILIKKKKS